MGNELNFGQHFVDSFLQLLPENIIANTEISADRNYVAASKQVVDELWNAVQAKEPGLCAGKWQKDKYNVIGYPSQSEGDMAFVGAIARIAVSMKLPLDILPDAVMECYLKSGMYRPIKRKTMANHTIPKAITSAVEGNRICIKTTVSGITAAELANKHFAPLNWVINDILPEGAYLLSARPKVGKSWLALQICISVAFGDDLWGRQVSQGKAVYLALEENQRRLQKRLSQLRNPWATPHLTLHTEWKRSDQGGIDDLETLLIDQKPRLVVIDTLAKIRAPAGKAGSAYEGDYNALAPITALANKYRCCILIVTHNRKGKSEGDAIEMVSGTLGQMGAVDGALIIDGDRGDSMMRLTLVGRDIEQDGEFAITKRKQGGWDWQGNATQAFASAERQQILNLLRLTHAGLKPSEVAARLNKSSGAVRKLMSSMALDMQIKRDKTGIYSV